MPPSLRAEHPPNPRTLPNGPVPTPIHRSAWKEGSPNFALREPSEVGGQGSFGFRLPPRLRDGRVRVRGGPGNPSPGGKMTEASRQPKDKNYNLISVLYHSSDNVESLRTYVQDAESEGDQELAEFFGAVLENNLTAAQRAKEMLVPRFQSEQE